VVTFVRELPADSTAYLLSLDSSFSNRKYVIPDNGIVIGRDQSLSGVVVSDKSISRQHLSIKQHDGDYVVVDLESSNGTYINSSLIDSITTLRDGDVIGLGSSSTAHLRFHRLFSRNNSSFSSELPPQESWIIGRDDTMDISLSFDPTVSASHAQISCKNNQLFIEDLHSLNGTFINGQKVHRAKIVETDTVVIGTTFFHFHLTDIKSLIVSHCESGDNVQLECVSLKRDVSVGQGVVKRILNDITLQVGVGEFVGILGPSGAGKSTLLKAICGHTAPDSGCVFLNETPMYRSYDMFRSVIGYVPQDDILHSELSVEKSLEYVARLRLPHDIDSQQRSKIVQTTMEALGLSNVRKNTIEQLSGGQRKRVSIGAELITRPSVLFLDEPTSGLDPSVEERLMHYFQEMAQQGTTVLITTHILYNLSLLDKIIFMAQGNVVFYGTPDEAMTFFKDGNVELTRPTEIFDLLEGVQGNVVKGIDNMGSKEQKESIALYYAQKYLESSYYREHIFRKLTTFAKDMYLFSTNEIIDNSTRNFQLQKLIETPTTGKWSISQLKNCFSPRYWFLLSMRHMQIRFAYVKQTLIYLLIPVILALVTLTQTVKGFSDEEVITHNRSEIVNSINLAGLQVEKQLQVLLSPESGEGKKSAVDLIHAIKYEGVANLPIPLGLLLMFVMTSIFMGTFVACQEISSEKTIRYREQMAGQRILDYIGSKLTFCLFITMAQCVVYLSICYLAPGLREVSFQGLFTVLILVAWTSVAMGLFISAVDPSNGKFSIILTIIIVLPQLILSGGLGPDFYGGMNGVTQAVANLLPAQQGLELLLTTVYNSDAGGILSWMPDFISDTVGFEFGGDVIWRDKLYLVMQIFCWLFFTILVLTLKKKV